MIEITAEQVEGGAVGLVRFADGDRNHLSPELLHGLLNAYQMLEAAGCRAIVLSTGSKHFCAGANFSGEDPGKTRSERASSPIYDLVPQLFDRKIPVIAVVDGAAIGGGLGLALSADFRIAGPTARFAANFTQIGMSQGFGLTYTLAQAIGKREASRLLYTSRRIDGQEAVRIGLCDSVANSREEAEAEALLFAHEIASCAPLAIHAVHGILNSELPNIIRATLVMELEYQRPLYATADFREGVLASRERRPAVFNGS